MVDGMSVVVNFILPLMSVMSPPPASGVVLEHSVKTPNADYCYFHMEILYVNI